jgi:ribosomal protein S18 acetylase RimI-like enzyme
MTAGLSIRPLTITDVDAYRVLRIEALSNNPGAFSASVEDEAKLSHADMASRAAPPLPSVTFGAFMDDRLVGMASCIVSPRAKTRHKASMVAVYVEPEWRAAKIGRSLVEAVIRHARSLGVILQCTVAAHNTAARSLYRKLGFLPYGLEHDALFVDGVFYDEELLALDLRSRAQP